MRIRSVLAALILGPACAGVHAGLAITVEDDGELVQQYFDQGRFLLVESGRPAFGVDSAGNCWFVDGQRLVADSCETMLGAASQLADAALAGLGPQERAMMARMAGAAAPMPPRRTGEATVAGYPAECYAVGDSREVCISPRLLGEVMREMGEGPFQSLFQRFGQTGFGPGGPDPAAGLFERGFPVRDMARATAIPGLDPAMLQFLPAPQRAQLMQQLGAGAAAAMQGSQVVAVERNASMPAVDLSRYRRVGFAEFMRESLGDLPPMR